MKYNTYLILFVGIVSASCTNLLGGLETSTPNRTLDRKSSLNGGGTKLEDKRKQIAKDYGLNEIFVKIDKHGNVLQETTDIIKGKKEKVNVFISKIKDAQKKLGNDFLICVDIKNKGTKKIKLKEIIGKIDLTDNRNFETIMKKVDDALGKKDEKDKKEEMEVEGLQCDISNLISILKKTYSFRKIKLCFQGRDDITISGTKDEGIIDIKNKKKLKRINEELRNIVRLLDKIGTDAINKQGTNKVTEDFIDILYSYGVDIKYKDLFRDDNDKIVSTYYDIVKKYQNPYFYFLLNYVLSGNEIKDDVKKIIEMIYYGIKKGYKLGPKTFYYLKKNNVAGKYIKEGDSMLSILFILSLSPIINKTIKEILGKLVEDVKNKSVNLKDEFADIYKKIKIEDVDIKDIVSVLGNITGVKIKLDNTNKIIEGITYLDGEIIDNKNFNKKRHNMFFFIKKFIEKVRKERDVILSLQKIFSAIIATKSRVFSRELEKCGCDMENYYAKLIVGLRENDKPDIMKNILKGILNWKVDDMEKIINIVQSRETIFLQIFLNQIKMDIYENEEDKDKINKDLEKIKPFEAILNKVSKIEGKKITSFDLLSEDMIFKGTGIFYGIKRRQKELVKLLLNYQSKRNIKSSMGSLSSRIRGLRFATALDFKGISDLQDIYMCKGKYKVKVSMDDNEEIDTEIETGVSFSNLFNIEGSRRLSTVKSLEELIRELKDSTGKEIKFSISINNAKICDMEKKGEMPYVALEKILEILDFKES